MKCAFILCCIYINELFLLVQGWEAEGYGQMRKILFVSNMGKTPAPLLWGVVTECYRAIRMNHSYLKNVTEY